MQAVTEEEILEILAQIPNLQCHGRSLHFDGPQAQSMNLSLKVSEPHQLVHLARLLAHLNYDEGHFAGAELDNPSIETRTTQMKEEVIQKLSSYDWIKT